MNTGVLLIVLGIAVALFLRATLGTFLVALGAILLVLPELRA